MKTCPLIPIGLLAGFTLALSPLSTNAQDDRPMPPPPRPEQAMDPRPDFPRPVDRMRQERGKPMNREAADRRLLEESIEAYRRGDPAAAGRLREAMRQPGEKRPGREAANKELLRKKPMPSVPPRVRIQHLRQAADHLQAAGFPDYADKARKEAERIAEQAAKQSKNDANPELTEKVNKLSRQVEELREQVRKLKAADAPKPPKDRDDRPKDPPSDPQPQ